MAKNYLHFKSMVPFEFYINSEYIASTTSKEQTIDFEINGYKKIFVKYIPVSSFETYLPYTQVIEINENSIKSLNDMVKIIPFPNSHWEIEFRPISITSNNSYSSKNFGKYFITISENNPSLISIYENGLLKKQHNLIGNAFNSIIKQKEKNIIIKSCLTNGDFEVCIVDSNTLDVLLDKVCETIEDTSEEIKILHRINKNCNIANISTFNLTNSQVKENLVMLSKPHQSKIDEIVAYQFLISIQNKNLSNISSLLDDSLINKISKENLLNYFDNISNIYYDRYNNNKIGFVIENNDKNKVYNYVNFNMQNHIIMDFESDKIVK